MGAGRCCRDNRRGGRESYLSDRERTLGRARDGCGRERALRKGEQRVGPVGGVCACTHPHPCGLAR